jgi:DNA mismatch repair protein MLH1
MLENSLDAGATSIAVLAKGGGLKLLQIQDTGHGIMRDDFGRVCERFATSKLREYEDLQQIETFGFRGEALASISHVAHVTITSMTDGSPCAYRACFAEGHLVSAKPGEAAEPKPCAGTRGTTIVVEDMFYNAPTRRSAMKSVAEEYGKLLQVVQAYAIDNAGVAISCSKGTECGAELRTLREHSTTDVIRQVFGASLARELLPVEGAEPSVGLTVRGLVSNASHSAKKLAFLLFINKRLKPNANKTSTQN